MPAINHNMLIALPFSNRPNWIFRSDGGTGGSSNGGSRTYVDNASNRNLGRVGLPLGSAVVSRSKKTIQLIFGYP